MDDQQGKKERHQQVFKPSEYMRARRPELFSDTLTSSVPILDKNQFDYYLDTLTGRKQEQLFEEFCRRLAELEICPNLRPQTGPTGGGDSKTDTSTYPVTDELAFRCYWGPNKPSGEEWAFAFSCKQKWKDKVKKDIQNISTLDRRFAKAIFISNQLIRDKARSETESALSKQHGFEVVIHDRSWIIAKVINNKREELAIEMLGIGGLQKRKPQLGPEDTTRQLKFEALIKQLGQPEIYHNNDYSLAVDYLNAAKLARGLEKPRHEIDGLYSRARNIAQNHGYKGLIIRCAYDHAWTSYFWFDDPDVVVTIYSEIERFLTGTDDAQECELFSNLWHLLYTAVAQGALTAEKAALDKRLMALNAELDRLAKDGQRPNNALHAKTLSHWLHLIEALKDPPKAEKIFDGLKSCLKLSSGLGAYPAMEFIDNLTEMGDFIGHLPGYESLFQEMCKVAKARRGETSEGKLLYERGIQLLEKGSPQDVLRYLGKARLKLLKEETLRASLRAALGCSDAYMSMGMLWAARMEALGVAHTALRTIEATYQFPIEGLLAIKRLAWYELSLGRIAPFLAWHQLSWLLVEILRSMQYTTELAENDLLNQDLVFGCFLLNLNAETISGIAKLTNKLDELNLPLSKSALLYSLGEIDAVKRELPSDFYNTEENLVDFFSRWKTQAAAEQFPKYLIGANPTFLNYETATMGVRYKITVKNSFAPILVAENLLGIIEAAFALAKWENLAFIVDEVLLTIDVSDAGTNPAEFDFSKTHGDKGYSLLWRSGLLEWLYQSDRSIIRDYFMRFLLMLLATITIDPLEDLEKELDQWHKEDTFSRAIGLSPTGILVADILGKESYELTHWLNPTASS